MPCCVYNWCHAKGSTRFFLFRWELSSNDLRTHHPGDAADDVPAWTGSIYGTKSPPRTLELRGGGTGGEGVRGEGIRGGDFGPTITGRDEGVLY